MESWLTYIVFFVFASFIIGISFFFSTLKQSADGTEKMPDMSLYWNMIAMPYFFIVLAFSLWMLFNIGGAATTDSRHISAAVADAMRIRNAAERRRRNAAAAANEENPE